MARYLPIHPMLRDAKEYHDPRPDLVEDSSLWLRLIVAADRYDPELCKKVWDFRGYGTLLVKGESGYYMRPLLTSESVWNTLGEFYHHLEKFFGQYREELRELLRSLEREGVFP